MPKPPKSPKRTNKHPHHKSTYKPGKLPVRIAHHKHTGRKLPFYCTSYAAVFFLLAFAASLLIFVSHAARASQLTQSGSINLLGEVKGDPPDTAANIESPPDGLRTTTSQLEIKGSCLPGKYIEITRNNNFVGMAYCDSGGIFSIVITLLPDENLIIARTRDNFGQYGPNSTTIKVFYDKVAALQVGQPTSSNNLSSTELLKPLQIIMEPDIYGTLIGQEITVSFRLEGDKSPYAVSVDWGDNEVGSLTSIQDNKVQKISHKYNKKGTFNIRINALGAAGGKALMQVVTIIYGAEDINIAAGLTCDKTPNTFPAHCYTTDPISELTDKIWPALLVSGLMVVSFWLGEVVIFTRLKT